MSAQRTESANGDKTEASSSGRWIRDQLRGVADSGLAELERSQAAQAVDAKPALAEPREQEPSAQADQAVLDSLASSISSAVVGPMRNLERNRVAHQQHMESSLQKLSQQLEEMQRRFGVMDRGLADAKASSARSQAAIAELRPGLDAFEGRLQGLEETFRKDLDALGAGLAEVREQVRPLEERLTSSEDAVARHTGALDGIERLEQRRQEATRQLASSVGGVRSSLNRLSSLERQAGEAEGGDDSDNIEPPAPEFLDEAERQEG